MADFTDYPWQVSYQTSSLKDDGSAVDILHDFYIPALQRAEKYDRVAGYFRSTSLAAASEGYTAFLDNQGKMRLIVGADMALADVEAILAGDKARFDNALLSELENSEAWPENVKAGVALLAYMVAQGRLEVKVAFRLHGQTGKPLSVEATEDGYVHEKWFLMEDREGHCLRGAGSLNESRQALKLNAENIDVNCSWEGGREAQRIEQARKDFDRLWNNKNPHMKVMSLPQAVREKLVKLRNLKGKLTEIDGTSAAELNKTLEPSLEELLKFAVLKDAPRMPGGIYIGMYSAPVEPWPHQEMVSRHLVESWPYSYLLCDEVGLGKTIESALAMRSLLLSGRIKRVLIAAPASLTAQWQRELAEKAMLDFYSSKPKAGQSGKILHKDLNENEYTDQDLYEPELNIVSTGLASRKERRSMLKMAALADVVLVDEAHYARRSNPQKGYWEEPKYGKLYDCIEHGFAARTKSLWLATATPMQIDPIEVYDLTKLMGRTAAFRYEPYLLEQYYELLSYIAQGKELKLDNWRLLGRSYAALEAADPYLLRLMEKTVVNGKNRQALKDLAKREPRGNDAKEVLKPLFSAAPLSRVMMRHTRKLLEEYRKHGELKSNLAKRHVLPLAIIAFSSKEKEFYAQLEVYCAGLMQQINAHRPDSKQMMAFYLNFLQLRFASSLFAIQQTLERRLMRVQATLKFGAYEFSSQEELQEYLNELEDDGEDTDENDISEISVDALLKDRSPEDLAWEQERLQEMLAQLGSMSHDTPTKIQELLNRLEQRRIVGSSNRMKQTVIFTRFFDSLQSIREYLSARAPGLHIGVYSGKETQWYDAEARCYRRVTREEIKNLFLTGKIDVLLCTDAAAEGLNLQTADMLINFDMGWNPMKIEQRIGRIDRIGQKHKDIFVLNMCYQGSTEEIVYGRLTNRLKKAGQIVGSQQVSILPIEPQDFIDLHSGKIDEVKLEKKARQRLKKQMENAKKMELDAEAQYDIYHKEHELMAKQPLPAKVEDLHNAIINSAYLKSMGMKVLKAGNGYRIEMPANEGFSGWQTTTNRQMSSSASPYMTWGNKAVDSLLSEMSDKLAEYKSYVRRINVPLADGEAVGYLVAANGGPLLVTSYDMLSQINIAQVPLTTMDIEKARGKLANLVAKEQEFYEQREKNKQINEEYALIHRALVKYVAIALLEKTGMESAQQAIKELEEHPRKAYTLELPVKMLEYRNRTLFTISSTGGRAHICTTPLLVGAAIALCHRTSSKLAKHKKKKEQTCQDLIDSLQR